MKRLFALLLTLALLCCVFAGCAKQSEAPAAEPAPAAEEAPAAETPAAEEPAAEPAAQPESGSAEAPPADQAPADQAPADQAPAAIDEAGTYNDDGTYTSPMGVTYPMGDGTKQVSLFIGFGFFDFGFDSMADYPRMPDIREQTGVDFVFREVNFSVQSEQFNLMVASGDMTDIFRSAELYTGGNAQAYEDEVIIDLADIIPVSAPDYWYRVEHSNQTTLDSMYTEGHIFQIQTITNAVYNDTGTYIRYDWLEELGMENPDSLQEFTDALYAFRDEKGAAEPYDCGVNGTVGTLSAAFGSPIYGIGGSTIGAYRNGDTIEAGIISDGFRAYLEWFNQGYSDGLFDRDFYVSEGTEQERYTSVAAGEIGCFPSTANSVLAMDKYAADNPVLIGGLNYICNDQGVFDFQAAATMTDKGYSTSTSAEDPAFVAGFLNYFFTQPGSRLCNYGKEDVSYTVDGDGNVTYTDLVLGSDDPGLVQFQQGFSDLPYFKDVFASSFQFNASQLNDLEIFSGSYAVTSDDHVIPTGAALNVEETSSIANPVTDVCTYADEAVLKFMIGSVPINDDTWGAYVQQCRDFNLDEAVAVYQTAYDQYLRGERTSAATAAAPPPDGGGAPPDGAAPPPA